MIMENMKSYEPMFINRKTGEEIPAGYSISLYPSEVIDRQVALSTVKTIVMFREVTVKEILTPKEVPA